MTGSIGGRPRDSHTLTVSLTVLVVLSAALAGCNAVGGGSTDAPAGTPSTTPPADGAETDPVPATDSAADPTTTDSAAADSTTTDEPGDIEQLRAAGVDPNATFERVERLLGVDAERPAVRVTEVPLRSETPEDDLQTVLFGEWTYDGETGVNTARFHQGTGVVFAERAVENRSAAVLEYTLAHEYVHALQWNYYGMGSISAESAPAFRAFREGSAQWAQFQYVSRYMNVSSERLRRVVRQGWANRTTRGRLGAAPYYHGRLWVNRTLDSPENFSALFEQPPATTEQMLHDTDEEPRSFVTATGPDLFDSDWRSGGTVTRGELWTRVALRDQVNRSTAVTAAEGWGADSMRVYRDGDGDVGVVWAHRWDSTTDADEAERAFRAYAEGRRGESDEYAFRVVRVSPETTALVAGSEGFIDGVAVEGTNRSVTVTLADG